jgi:polyhydroxybutyrate depolymerase
LLIIHGTNDVSYPPGGREIGDSTTGFPLQALSIESTVTYWLSRNACDPESRVDTGNDAVLLFDGCTDDTEVGIYLIFGNGHHWTRLGDEYTLNQFDIDTTETILRFFNDDDTWTQKQHEPRPASEARTYRYYLPSSYDPSTPTPVVVVLHGRPGNSTGIALITDMNPVAEREGFIALYPEGITQGGGWNYLRPIMINPEEGVDDSAFMKTMIDDLSNDLNIDRSRVYVTGFSNGGFMTELLACEAQDTFAAFITVGASAFPGLDRACAGQDAVPFMLIHGTADVSVPFAGLRQRTPSGDQVSVTFPIPDTVGFWAAHNGCDPTVDTTAIPQQGQSPDTEVFINAFSNCTEGSTFVYYLIDGGGHNWPGVPGVIGEEIAGNVNTDINASDLAWAFFQQFTLDTE